jgi:hypothetical protein
MLLSSHILPRKRLLVVYDVSGVFGSQGNLPKDAVALGLTVLGRLTVTGEVRSVLIGGESSVVGGVKGNH